MAYEKILPIIDAEGKEFWEKLKQHQLSVQKCSECDSLRFPPRVICPKCLSDKTEWQKVSGKGTVYSFVDMYAVSHPKFAEEAPYNLSIIELEEGVKIWSNVIKCKPEEVYIGMPVKIIYEDITEDIALAKCEPVK